MAGDEKPGDWLRNYQVVQPVYERKGHRLQGRGLQGVGFYCECGLATTSLSPQAFGQCPLALGTKTEEVI